MSHMDSGHGPYAQQYPPVYGYGPPRNWGRPQYPIETKPFYLTSEFVGAALAIAGIAITAMSSDAFGAWRAWILITAVIVGYMVSRGIAKSGTRSNANDPREHMSMNWGRGDSNSQGSNSQGSYGSHSQGNGDSQTQVRTPQHEEDKGPLFG
jgi:hypothetical protein